jgi:hypothetical protein
MIICSTAPLGLVPSSRSGRRNDGGRRALDLPWLRLNAARPGDGFVIKRVRDADAVDAASVTQQFHRLWFVRKDGSATQKIQIDLVH